MNKKILASLFAVGLAAGCVCYFRESSMVTFTAEGAGEILAVDNGNLMGSEPYHETMIHMLQGEASVLVRSGESGESFRVLAWAPGLKSAAVVCRIIQ